MAVEYLQRFGPNAGYFVDGQRVDKVSYHVLKG